MGNEGTSRFGSEFEVCSRLREVQKPGEMSALRLWSRSRAMAIRGMLGVWALALTCVVDACAADGCVKRTRKRYGPGQFVLLRGEWVTREIGLG